MAETDRREANWRAAGTLARASHELACSGDQHVYPDFCCSCVAVGADHPAAKFHHQSRIRSHAFGRTDDRNSSNEAPTSAGEGPAPTSSAAGTGAAAYCQVDRSKAAGRAEAQTD